MNDFFFEFAVFSLAFFAAARFIFLATVFSYRFVASLSFSVRRAALSAARSTFSRARRFLAALRAAVRSTFFFSAFRIFSARVIANWIFLSSIACLR